MSEQCNFWLDSNTDQVVKWPRHLLPGAPPINRIVRCTLEPEHEGDHVFPADRLGAGGRGGEEDQMSIKSWKARGLTLSPGTEGFHVDDLVMFARQVQDQFPNGTVMVGEHGDLRVISREGDGPYFDWRD